MKFSLFNRPHLGMRAGFDLYSIAAGIAASVSVVVSYPWLFIGG